MGKTHLKDLFAVSVAAMLISLAGCSAKKTVEAGSTWEVVGTTSLSNLVIADEAAVKAPEDSSVTMTVNRIETELKAGTYKGDIVLTVTKAIENPVSMGGPPGGDSSGGPGGGTPGGAAGGPGETPGGGAQGAIDAGVVRTAIYIDGGMYVPEKSVPAAVVNGKVTNTSATDISISSVGKDFNGIIITGDSEYSISNLKIDFDGGDQGNNGAGVTSGGNADVTINNASIISKGVQRAGIVVGGNSTMHVNDSYIEAHDGTLLEQFARMEDSNSMEVPWVLGFIGNNRATNVVQNGTAYYNNTRVKTQKWGCLSTDAAQTVRLYATNCRLEAVESGYGAYADRGCTDLFDGCRFDVKDYGFITSGGSGTFTNGTIVNSARFGVMAHGSGTIIIDGGSEFNTKKAAIQVKSAKPTILVDNAELNPENGIILEAIVNDDPWKSGMPGSSMPGGTPAGGAPAGAMPGPGVSDSSTDVNAGFKNVTLKGDIVSSMTGEGDVVVTFENAAITGAITTATSKSQADIDGVKIAKKYYYYIGEVSHTYCAIDDKYGMKVSLDGNSSWIVDKTSYLTALTIAEGASVKAPEGANLIMTVNGIKKAIGAGSYNGKIVLEVK